jgi:hypothetical protein
MKPFRRNIILVVMAIWFLLLPQTLQAQQKVAVEVKHKGSDSIGSRLAYQVKERIRSSSGLRIATANEPRVILYLVTADIFGDKPGSASALGFSIAVRGQSGPLEHLLYAGVATCGSQSINETSERLIADIDKEAHDFLESDLRRQGGQFAWTK